MFSAEEAAERVARNRAARLRFSATEADRAERLKGEPEPHTVRGEVAPTAATKARLKPDVLRRLERSGKIGMDHVLAANDIRTIFEALVRDLLPRAGQIRLGVAHRTAFVPSIERLPAALAARYEQAYKPWANAFGDRWWRVRGAGQRVDLRCSVVQIVLDVVVDNRTIDEVAGDLGLRMCTARGIVIGILAEALDDYACRAAIVCENAA